MRNGAERLFVGIVFFTWLVCGMAFLYAFPSPCYHLVKSSGVSPSLVYAVIKAESNFRSDAVSHRGAVGLMQLLPSTARFICEREGIAFSASRLAEEEYNLTLGCAYLNYLMQRFHCVETAIAAYNAGEGTVAKWLSDERLSADGVVLSHVPYSETRTYVKKVKKFLKIYKIVCD